MPDKPLFSFDWEGKAVGVNNRYVSKTSKALTDGYRDFQEGIRYACCHGIPRLTPSTTVPVFLSIVMAIVPGRDSDSLIKPLFDGMEWNAFTKLGRLKNDNLIRGYYVGTTSRTGMVDIIHVTAYRWVYPDDISINELIELCNR